MKTIFDNIFLANGFEKAKENLNVAFYQKANLNEPQEYFLIETLSKNDFVERIEVFDSSLSLFQEQKSLRANIDKNTSLVIAVKADNLRADFPVLKNKILKIEEDTYWFKKYVVVYTEAGVAPFLESENILNDLSRILLDVEKFRVFKETFYSDESFFITMQLYLKLPFLRTPIDGDAELLSIENLVRQSLSQLQQQLLTKLKGYGNIDGTLNWSQVRDLALSQDSQEELIDGFLAKFDSNAQA